MKTLRVDIETYSSQDLRKCGVYRYADSLDFEILLFGYAYDDGPVQIVDFASGESMPPELMGDLNNPDVIKTAFNAAFEIACLNAHFCMKLDPRQWRCTSVHALTLGLPGSLAEVGSVVQLPKDHQKMMGWTLIKYFCMPCLPTKANNERTRNFPHHAPEKWREFKAYCVGDVVAERFVAQKLELFPIPEKEQDLWVLDQRMNSTGVAVDKAFVENAITIGSTVRESQLAQATALTGLSNPNSRNQLLAWLQLTEEGVTDLTKKSIPAILEKTDSHIVKEVLELRQELAKTSVTKYDAMLRCVCSDGRIKGLTRFYGANRTGRWAGQLVQVQNLPQNHLLDLDAARQLVKQGDLETLQMMFGNVPDTLSQLIRTAFVGPFVVVDFNAIEARVLAWMSNCQWRMDVFNSHMKIYEASAEQMFKLLPGSVDKKSPYRQKGKIAELALGYGGGAGALKTMGALEMGLTEDELEPIKVAWRKANPEIVQFWYACESAAKRAILERKMQTLAIGQSSELKFSYESGFLFIELPSKRRLAYVKPRLEKEDLVKDGYTVARTDSITYEGNDQKTKKWSRIGTYGGKLCENITQAVARDCLREAMFAVSDAGYSMVMTVHDEIVIETASGLEAITEIMSRPINWALGLPLKADGFATPYYCKEIQ